MWAMNQILRAVVSN